MSFLVAAGSLELSSRVSALPEFIDKFLPISDYYQWVPLVLGLQAILYYIPRIVWSIFTYNRTGTDLQNLVRTASNAAKEDGEKREKTIRHLAKSLELMLFSRRQYHSRRDGRVNRAVVHLPGKRHGNNLIYYYIFIKLLYVIVGILQLYLMYAFLRFDQKEGYFFFGVRILDDIRKGKPWTETQVFPRVGVCRQALQHVAATNNLFAQCVLPINMLNEKIYVFLYFFLAGVMFFTILSIPLWIFRIAPKRQGHFVKRFLKMADAYNRDDPHQRDLIDRFVTEFLRQDGHFLLRMLSMNAGDLITVEIVCCLFGDYRKQYYGKDFRGLKSAKSDVNEYGDPLKMKLAAAEKPPYPAGPSVPNGDFMSAKLQPGGYATTKQRPLPTAPPGGSPPYPQVIDGEDFKQVVAPPVYPTLPEYPGPEQDVAIIHRPPPPPHLRTPSGHLLQAPATPQPKEEGSSSPKEVKTSNV